MKKILFLIISITLMFSCFNVYAQGMSKYGYPEGYKPNKTVNALQNTTQNNSNSNNSNYELFPHNINPAILSVNNMLSVSYSDLGLNYGEYANNGYSLSLNGGSPDKYLDTENGFLNGFKISLSNTFYHFYNEANFSYYSGNDTYTGSKQGGVFGSVINTTSSKIYNFNYKLGYMIPITNNFVITPYGELGWHIWKRDNIGGNSGQNEHYSNWIAMIGILGQYAFTSKLVGDVGFSYGTTFDAQIQANEVDTTLANYNTLTNTWSYSYADTTWDLGSKSIYNIIAGLNYRFYSHFNIFGNVKYERFKYGQSSIYTYITNKYQDGIYTGYQLSENWEPNSVTNEIIYSIGLGYSF
jgi:hypothetical protein